MPNPNRPADASPTSQLARVPIGVARCVTTSALFVHPGVSLDKNVQNNVAYRAVVGH